MSKEDEVREDFSIYSTHWEAVADGLAKPSSVHSNEQREALLDRADEISAYLKKVETLIEAGNYSGADDMMKDNPIDD